MLKRVITYGMCAGLVLALALPVGAVKKADKDEKKTSVTKVDHTRKTGSNAKKAASSKDAKAAEKKKAPSQGRYDTFIDENNNGIDDRKEKLKKKDPVKTKSDTEKKQQKKK